LTESIVQFVYCVKTRHIRTHAHAIRRQHREDFRQEGARDEPSGTRRSTESARKPFDRRPRSTNVFFYPLSGTRTLSFSGNSVRKVDRFETEKNCCTKTRRNITSNFLTIAARSPRSQNSSIKLLRSSKEKVSERVLRRHHHQAREYRSSNDVVEQGDRVGRSADGRDVRDETATTERQTVSGLFIYLFIYLCVTN